MKKEIYFLTNTKAIEVFAPIGRDLITYDRTLEAIDNHESIIYTTQLALLSFDLLTEYDIYVCRDKYKLQMKPGMVCPCGKEIREDHNLFKLFRAGYFDDCFTDEKSNCSKKSNSSNEEGFTWDGKYLKSKEALYTSPDGFTWDGKYLKSIDGKITYERLNEFQP